MSMLNNFRWPVAVLSFVITLALCTGALAYRQKQMLDDPLVNLLESREGIKNIALSREEDILVIRAEADYVENVSELYRQLMNEASGLLGNKPFRLELADTRDAFLEEAYFAVHLALYEGERRGNFTEMEEVIAQRLKALELPDHKVFVDRENIYFQVRNEDRYLYEIIRRESLPGEAT